MCLQCVTEAETIIEFPIIGYWLMQSKKGHPDWPEGYFGLVKCNDPDFVWEGEVYYDPLDEMTDDEIDAIPKGDPLWEKYWAFSEHVDRVEPAFSCRPELGYQFVNACIASGYNRHKDGYVLYWFISRIGKMLEKKRIDNSERS